MNYINFERKYVSNGIAGSIDTIFLWKHQNGSVCEIEQYMTPNYVYMRFENGIEYLYNRPTGGDNIFQGAF